MMVFPVGDVTTGCLRLLQILRRGIFYVSVQYVIQKYIWLDRVICTAPITRTETKMAVKELKGDYDAFVILLIIWIIYMVGYVIGFLRGSSFCF